jgi:hypothetical protein
VQSNHGHLVKKVLHCPQATSLEQNAVHGREADSPDRPAIPSLTINAVQRAEPLWLTISDLPSGVAAMPLRLNSPEVSAAGPLR